MNRFILSLIMLVTVFWGMEAQSDSKVENDTLKAQELKEVVVTATQQRVVKYGVEYTPDKKTKKQAVDATNLLELMAVPQLYINPVSHEVKTIGLQEVSIFIDFQPATKQDLEGMRTEDVLRVEVLQFPQDPRFNSAPNVVNYIMRKYKWGGYTKLTAKGTALSQTLGYGSVYSKFSSGNWSFDVATGGEGSRRTMFYTHEEETFRDVNFNGNYYPSITQITESGDDQLEKNNSQWFNIRAVYSSKKMTLRHRAGFFRDAMPLNRTTSNVRFSDHTLSPTVSTGLSSKQSLSPSIDGLYLFYLPNKNTLRLQWSVSYGGNRSFSNSELIGYTPIVNDNKEKTFNPTINVSYSQNLGHNNTLRFSLMSFNDIYDTHYSGSYIGRQKLLSSENMLFIEYMQNWKCGLNLFSRLGGSYTIGRVNGVNTLKAFNPRLGLQLQYQINSHHRVSGEAWWGNSHPYPSWANTAIVRHSELMWYKGNPELKNSLMLSSALSYSFIASKKFTTSVNLRYDGQYDKQANNFFSMEGYDGLIKQLINSGNEHDWTASLSATLKLLNNSLVINGSGWMQHAMLTCNDAKKLSWLQGNLTVSYYLGNCYFTVYYNTRGKNLGSWNTGAYLKFPHRYGFNFNYSLKNFKLALQLLNPFSKYDKVRLFYSVPRYERSVATMDMYFARRLSLTLTYTFSYGKKIKTNNELSSGSAAGSAILK